MFMAFAGGLEVGMMNLVVFERMPRPAQAGTRWCYLSNAFVLPELREDPRIPL